MSQSTQCLGSLVPLAILLLCVVIGGVLGALVLCFSVCHGTRVGQSNKLVLGSAMLATLLGVCSPLWESTEGVGVRRS